MYAYRQADNAGNICSIECSCSLSRVARNKGIAKCIFVFLSQFSVNSFYLYVSQNSGGSLSLALFLLESSSKKTLCYYRHRPFDQQCTFQFRPQKELVGDTFLFQISGQPVVWLFKNRRLAHHDGFRLDWTEIQLDSTDN